LAILIKKDIFKNLMWYILQGGAKHYPLTIRRVKEIMQLNSKGIKPDDLQPVELTTSKEAEHSFVDVVGHLTIGNLEKTSQRNKEKQRQQKRNTNQQQRIHSNKPKPQPPYNKANPRQQQNNNNRNKPPQKD
jgi:hypothetical protein